MNLGFIDSNIEELTDYLSNWEGAKGMMPQAYLYYVGLSKLNPGNIENVLEVGPGLGGGTILVDRMFNPEKILGLDRSPLNVVNCRIKFKDFKNIEFIQGSYKDLARFKPVFDLVLCVEASQHFEMFSDFLANTYKILKPNGRFVLTDLFLTEELAEIEETLHSVGFRIENKSLLTLGVLESIALNPHMDERQYLFARLEKWFLGLGGLEAHSGSKLFMMLESGELQFISYILAKD